MLHLRFERGKLHFPLKGPYPLAVNNHADSLPGDGRGVGGEISNMLDISQWSPGDSGRPAIGRVGDQ